MDLSIIEKLLAGAGLGGVCVGILLLIFKETLRAKFLSKLSGDHSFQIIKSIIWLTWSIALVGLLTWAGLRVLEVFYPVQAYSGPVKPNETQSPKIELHKLEKRIPDNTPETDVEEAHIELEYIQIAGLGNKVLEKMINESIKQTVSVNESYDGTEDLTMKVMNSSLEGDLLSVLVEGTYYGHGAAGAANQVRSINLNIKTGEPVEFKDLFRSGYQKPLNQLVETWFSQQNFASSFESVTDDQCYFFDGSYLYLCFSEYEVAPGAEGIVKAKLKLEEIRGAVSLNGPLAYVL